MHPSNQIPFIHNFLSMAVIENTRIENPPIPTLREKVWKVVKFIFNSLLGVAFFVSNPTIFAIGLIIGVALDKKVQEFISKIIMIWKTQPWSIIAIAGIGAFLSLQVSWAASSFIFAANLGSKLSRKAQEIFRRDNGVLMV